jgi:hypothetical protein
MSSWRRQSRWDPKSWRPRAGHDASSADVWRDYVAVYDSTVCVSLGDADLSDADLEPLTKYLDKLLNQVWKTHWCYNLDLDLSRNCGITDFGVSVHIVRFLRVWPACRRFKLYQTSIGNEALQALTPWIASGFVQELHLSDLCGTVDGEVVLHFLREINWRGNYPYRNSKDERVALWLRLEHNGIPDPDQLISAAHAEGLSVTALDKKDLVTIRPGTACKSRALVGINLVLFRMQTRKTPKQHDNVNGRQALLSILHIDSNDSPPRPKAISDPQPLSVDEYNLWVMEAREDEESGANCRNKDTFGDDADDSGWTFEENLAANERIAYQSSQRPLDWLNEGLCPKEPYLVEHAQHPLPDQRSSSRKDRARVGAGDVRYEIEEEVQDILSVCSTLRRMDFDGHVRQHLHAIRSLGGRARVREAMHLINEAVGSRTRADINNWPAYLLRLLKQFRKQLKDGGITVASPVLQPNPVPVQVSINPLEEITVYQ